MGTRFLLTSDSTVPDAVKQRYLQAGLDGTVVSTRVDGMPHRVLRTPLVDRLESGSRVKGFAAAVRNAAKFKKMSGMTWRTMVRDGLAMRHGKDLTWSQVLMAANTPDAPACRSGRGQYGCRRVGVGPSGRDSR